MSQPSLKAIVLILSSCIAVSLSDQQCTDLFGTCQYISNACSGDYVSGKCDGPWDRKCCIPNFVDSACDAVSGTCQNTANPCQGGSYVTGKCDGPNNRVCCVPDPDFDDSACDAVSGTCQYIVNPCQGGNYVIGKCDGPNDRRCCVPGCSGVTIVSRAEWGAASPSGPISTMTTPVGLLFIHHTAGSSCSSHASCIDVVKSVQNYHMNTRNYYDIGYNFLVGGNGYIYEGRGWDKWGAHTLGFNSRSVAISFMGNFQTQSPTDAALSAAKALIACGVSQGKLTAAYKLYGHRQADEASTSCPGNVLQSEIETWSNYQSGTAY